MKLNIEWRETVVDAGHVEVQRRATMSTGETTGWIARGDFEDEICRVIRAYGATVLRNDVATAIANAIDRLRTRAEARAEAQVKPGRHRTAEVAEARMRAKLRLDWLRLRLWSGPQLTAKAKLRSRSIRVTIPTAQIKKGGRRER